VKKIVITGGLGYIGTELCKIYSGESRYKKIVVLDNRFISERVKQLRDWGIEFVQGDILDKELVSKVLKGATTIHHLAGVTDVAYTKTEANDIQDEKIQQVGREGTLNIINFSPDDSKIIFPSTHVVYEGLQEAKHHLTEEESVCPVLTYAAGKSLSEEDFHTSSKNFVILRLASVYGYSTDTMRVGIMPNLFSRIASQNGNIRLFAGGIQYKSLVPLVDVARCFKFMEERNDISREVFHCSKENVTVKEVAELCKKYNPNLTLMETDDEIPNLGYTLSNKKLLDTGFEFRYALEKSLAEMINNWSSNPSPEGLEYLVRGANEFVDDRGKISNYELSEPINLIGYIESKAGTMRANHYHEIQEQKCLLIQGSYVSVIKDLSDPTAAVETRMVRAGDLSVIKPNVAHTMVFLEDSIFLNLVRGEREHENYGVTHTKPYKLVSEKMRDDIVSHYKTSCRSCANENLLDVISLGSLPLANNLLDTQEDPEDTYPLEMKYCPECHNCQLSYVVPPQLMFDNYLYVSSTTQTLRQHFEDAAHQYIKEFNLDKNSFVMDIGSNDGVALRPFAEKNIEVLGVEPAKNICDIAIQSGIPTHHGYFDGTLRTEKKADIITASNVFAHADDVKGITKNVFNLLKDNGVFIVEVQYLLDTINDLTFDNIYHEHVNYWSVTSLNNFFRGLGYTVYKVEHIPTHGGSIRAYVRQDAIAPQDSVQQFLDREEKEGLLSYSTYKNFATRIQEAKVNFNRNIDKMRNEGLKIAGYGSPAKATTALNFYGISDEIEFIVEDNKLKHNKFLPGIRTPIVPKTILKDNLPDKMLILAWNYATEIMKNNSNLGVEFVSIKDLENYTP
jgi:nucleoside-diphosphate-sugar epimerase/SAM-dependent methyltransferase